MTVNIERRRLVIGGALGLGALVLPIGRSLCAEVLGAKGFTHNVASGEPGSDSMLLWTRYVPATSVDEVRLEAEIALDRDFTRVVFNSNWGVKSQTDVDAYVVEIPPGVLKP